MIGVTAVLAAADFFLASHKEKKIKINDEEELPVSGDKTLLNVLSENEIFIPSACGGKATCGHCKVEVEEGGGEVLPTEEVLLTPEDQENNVRLACQVKVKDDISIQLPVELLDVEEYTAEILEIRDVTPLIKYIRMKLISPQEIDFKPGQYVQIMVPGFEEYRAYSIASPPSQKDLVEFTIRLIPGGLCTSYIHFALEEGDTVKFTGPYGDFYLREDSDREVICIGGGAGMAPLRSIVYHLREQGMPRPTRYYFGAQAIKDIFFEEEFRQIEEEYSDFKFYLALSDPDPNDDWDGDIGFITDSVAKYEDSLENAEAYLCGPPPMLRAAERVLADKNMPPENVRYDEF